MAAPAHYIRSIHTSFTAAHPPSSAWTSAASRSSQQAHIHLAHHNTGSAESIGLSQQSLHYQQSQPHHHREVGHVSQRAASYSQGPYHAQTGYNAFTPSGGVSINTHNHHSYTHHLQNLGQPLHHQGYSQGHGAAQGHGHSQQYFRKSPPGLTTTSIAGGPAPSASGAGGRRRAVSIRVAPTAYAPIARSPSPSYKFDPFADEPVLPSGGGGTTLSSPLTSSFQANKSRSDSNPTQSQSVDYAPKETSAAPYTIHIPAAAPVDIQRYSPAPSRPATLRSLSPISGPSVTPTSVITPAAAAQAKAQSANLSKIVAGMLLNRAQAVPMRRRVLPRLVEGAATTGYRKSSLSSVISVEA